MCSFFFLSVCVCVFVKVPLFCLRGIKSSVVMHGTRSALLWFFIGKNNDISTRSVLYRSDL